MNHEFSRPSICHNEKLGQLLSVPVNNLRRASDGGINIWLFNQLYYNKHGNHHQPPPYLTTTNPTNNITSNSEASSPKNAAASQDEDSNNIQLDNLKIYSEEGNGGVNSNNEEDENEIEQENRLRAYRSSFKQRGSITSGLPILSVTSSSGLPLNSKQIGSQSSEDEEANASYSGGSSNSMKYQRRSSKSRHEPYLDNSPNNSINLNTNLGYGINSVTNIGKTSPPYRTRQREQSFSGSNSQDRFNSSIHRGSEPNPFDLISANM